MVGGAGRITATFLTAMFKVSPPSDAARNPFKVLFQTVRTDSVTQILSSFRLSVAECVKVKTQELRQQRLAKMGLDEE